MDIRKFIFLNLLLFTVCNVFAQQDSVFQSLQELPEKYLKSTEKKIDRYTKRITTKTEKTLVKLTKWEAKVKVILQKVNPEAASRLFSNEDICFKGMLVKFRKGELTMLRYKGAYDEYMDKLTTQLTYLDSNKNFLPVSKQLLISRTKQKSENVIEKERANYILQKMLRNVKRN